MVPKVGILDVRKDFFVIVPCNGKIFFPLPLEYPSHIINSSFPERIRLLHPFPAYSRNFSALRKINSDFFLPTYDSTYRYARLKFTTQKGYDSQ